MGKERYFIVFLVADMNGTSVHLSQLVRGQNFPSRRELIGSCSDYHRISADNIDVTNIIEFSEEDFNNWQS